jgi:hypothetical protein
MTIYQAIPKIASEVGAIGKDRSNDVQHYKFRGIDDVYNALNALMAKHGVFTVPKVLEHAREERPSKSGGILIWTILKIEYTFYADDGSNVVVVVIGEGMDSGDKSANKAMSVGHKYALLQVFNIPTEEPKDPENDSPEPVKVTIGANKVVDATPEQARAIMDAQFGNRDGGKLKWEDEIMPLGKDANGKKFSQCTPFQLSQAIKAWDTDAAIQAKYPTLRQHIIEFTNDKGINL